MSRRKSKKAGVARRRRQRTLNIGSPQSALTLRKPSEKGVAWPGELDGDAAVFDKSRRETLPPEAAAEAALVADALDDIAARRDEKALARLSSISRSSPFSQWRLFARGLIHWYGGEFDQADECWKRLDSTRRPSVIARVLQGAQQTEAGQLPAGADADGAAGPQIRDAIKRAHRLQFARPALAEVERETQRPLAEDETFTFRQKEWLAKFRRQYRDTEPELVQAVESAALALSFHQADNRVFDGLWRTIKGPPHDPTNGLLAAQYEQSFENHDRKRAERLEKDYITDILKRDSLALQLRKAIAHLLILWRARYAVRASRRSSLHSFLPFMFSQPADPRGIHADYQAALSHYPANSAAHREFTTWLTRQSEYAEWADEQLIAAMKFWSESVPDDVEPRLFLVDHFLENGQVDEARIHVDVLSRARLDDPRVRSLPWRCALIESMQLSRRKKQVPAAFERLRDAEGDWPAWLSKQWVPYLQAALHLRVGDTEQYQQTRHSVQPNVGAVTDAVMMFAAAVQMRVPSAELRELRNVVNGYAANTAAIAAADLWELGQFFWDLTRNHLMYRGYRNHGSKFGGELVKRITGSGSSKEPGRAAALLWGAEYEFWQKLDTLRKRFDIGSSPLLTAAELRLSLNQGMGYRIPPGTREMVASLKAAARTETDAYYRHYFAATVSEVEEAISGSYDTPGDAATFAQSFNSPFETEDEPRDESRDERPPAAAKKYPKPLSKNVDIGFQAFREMGFAEPEVKKLLADRDEWLKVRDPLCFCLNCAASRAALAYHNGDNESAQTEVHQYYEARYDAIEPEFSEDDLLEMGFDGFDVEELMESPEDWIREREPDCDCLLCVASRAAAAFRCGDLESAQDQVASYYEDVDEPDSFSRTFDGLDDDDDFQPQSAAASSQRPEEERPPKDWRKRKNPFSKSKKKRRK